ncbi:hypothetical protein DY000_02013492 [Brassica cretica]|uniref:HTH myb-type domain-containing protein n=1 Tax=Brassica cretica TaxID=69181 RepID=A0ABQ7CZF2_BRACR|nr:hypothetical protein DY000_02013492 [Brassica cretica]
MGRKPCCDKIGLRRGPWSIEEDHRLMNFILNNGIHCWRIVPKLAVVQCLHVHEGLLRCGKSCRLRWINYLRPDLKRGGFTDAEEDRIMELHSQLGNRYRFFFFSGLRSSTSGCEGLLGDVYIICEHVDCFGIIRDGIHQMVNAYQQLDRSLWAS